MGLSTTKRRKVSRKAKPPKPKPKPTPKPKLILIRVYEPRLRHMIREAARVGLVEAIEHTSNFWAISDGYKKYIEQQIAWQSEALMAAVRTALREEYAVMQAKRRKPIDPTRG